MIWQPMLGSLWLTHTHTMSTCTHTYIQTYTRNKTKTRNSANKEKKHSPELPPWCHLNVMILLGSTGLMLLVTQAPGCFWSTLGLGVKLSYSALFTTSCRRNKQPSYNSIKWACFKRQSLLFKKQKPTGFGCGRDSLSSPSNIPQ